MSDTILKSTGGIPVINQVTHMGEVDGKLDIGVHFVLKNNSLDTFNIMAIPAGQIEPIETVIFPGWNPEVYREILSCDAPKGMCQYGY